MRNLYIQEANSSESEVSESSNEDKDDESPKEFMLMATEKLKVEVINYGEEDTEVELERDLVSALEEIYLCYLIAYNTCNVH